MSMASENYSLFGGASGTRTQARSVMSFRIYNNYTFQASVQKGKKLFYLKALWRFFD